MNKAQKETHIDATIRALTEQDVGPFYKTLLGYAAKHPDGVTQLEGAVFLTAQFKINSLQDPQFKETCEAVRIRHNTLILAEATLEHLKKHEYGPFGGQQNIATNGLGMDTIDTVIETVAILNLNMKRGDINEEIIKSAKQAILDFHNAQFLPAAPGYFLG